MILFDSDKKTKNKEAIEKFIEDEGGVEDPDVGLILIKTSSKDGGFAVSQLVMSNISVLESNFTLDVCKDYLVASHFGDDDDV